MCFILVGRDDRKGRERINREWSTFDRQQPYYSARPSDCFDGGAMSLSDLERSALVHSTSDKMDKLQEHRHRDVQSFIHVVDDTERSSFVLSRAFDHQRCRPDEV